MLGRPSWFSDHKEIFRLFVMWILDQVGDASTLRILKVKNEKTEYFPMAGRCM